MYRQDDSRTSVCESKPSADSEAPAHCRHVSRARGPRSRKEEKTPPRRGDRERNDTEARSSIDRTHPLLKKTQTTRSERSEARDAGDALQRERKREREREREREGERGRERNRKGCVDDSVGWRSLSLSRRRGNGLGATWRSGEGGISGKVILQKSGSEAAPGQRAALLSRLSPETPLPRGVYR